MEFPVDQIAPAVDGVIGEQLVRLAALFSGQGESGTVTEEPQEDPAGDASAAAASDDDPK